MLFLFTFLQLIFTYNRQAHNCLFMTFFWSRFNLVAILCNLGERSTQERTPSTEDSINYLRINTYWSGKWNSPRRVAARAGRVALFASAAISTIVGGWFSINAAGVRVCARGRARLILINSHLPHQRLILRLPPKLEAKQAKNFW